MNNVVSKKRTPYWGGAMLVIAALIAMLLVLAPVAGRVAAQDEEPEPDATVRIVHASPGSPDVDVLVDGEPVAEALAFGAASDYASVAGGEHQVQIVPAGQPADDAIVETDVELDSGNAYIIAAVGALNEIEAEVYDVDVDAVEAGKARVRVIHTSPDAGEVDLAVTGGDTLFEGVESRDATDYEEIDAGTYDLDLVPADDDAEGALLSNPGVVFDEGVVYDLFVVGQTGDDSLALLSLATTVSSPCSSLLGVGGEDDACVRIVHTSPDAPEIDVYVNDSMVIEALPFGDATDFLALPAGDDVTVKFVPTGSPEDESVIDQEIGLNAGQAYQLFAIGLLDDIDLLTNEVDLTPLPEGQARLRVVHAGPDAGEVDVMVAEGDTLFDDVDFKDSTDYTVVNADTYDLEVRDDSGEDVKIRAEGVALDAGTVYDAVAIGQEEDQSLTIILLTANATLREGGAATPTAGTPEPVLVPDEATPDVVGTPVS